MRRAYAQFRRVYKHEIDRMQFTVWETCRHELFHSIQQKIEELAKLLDVSDQVAALEQPTRSVLPARGIHGLLQYWQHASRVYGLMYQKWGCACKSTHCAHIWLQHRTSKDFEFRMLVLFASKAMDASPTAPWQQHGLQIHWIAGETPTFKEPIMLVNQ